ncbi:MAG: glycosyltransferase family 4 protein [Rhodanobacter sp.]
MKILYLHQYFVTPNMAGGTRSYEMARRLVARGHEVHMITTWFDGPPPTEVTGWFTDVVDGIHVHWLPVPYSNKLSYLRRVLAFLHFAWSAARRATNIGGDVVFATSTPLTIAIPAIRVKNQLRVPMVFEVRDLWPELPIAIGALRSRVLIRLARWLEHRAYRNAARVVALSPGMAAGVERAGYDAARISVIPNSADLDLFDPKQVSSEPFLDGHPELRGRPVVLYPGTLGKINGVAWFAELAAVVQASRPDVCFVVIGDGMERDHVEARARALGVFGKNFYMLPRLAKRSIVSAYACAAIVVSLFIDLPEMQANSANKFFDALAAGKPVAINYGGWQESLLDETGAGVAMGPDVNRAAEALLTLLASEDRLLLAGRAARLLAEARFSRDRLALQLEDVLKSAVADVGDNRVKKNTN